MRFKGVSIYAFQSMTNQAYSPVLQEILSNAGISISTVDQASGEGKGVASLILTTHRSTEKAMAGAVADLKDEPSVLENPVLLRIFESIRLKSSHLFSYFSF